VNLRKPDPIASLREEENDTIPSLLMDLFDGDEEERRSLAEGIERRARSN